jgi:dTMP kinase
VPWLRQLNSHARRPDLTLILDVAADVAERRRADRGGEPELFETRELQRRLAIIYAGGEALVPHDRALHVSGEGSEQEVAERLLEALDRSGVLPSVDPSRT